MKYKWHRCKSKEEALRILGMDKQADKPPEDPKPAEASVVRRPNGVKGREGRSEMKRQYDKVWGSRIQLASGRNWETPGTSDRMLARIDGIGMVEGAFRHSVLDWVSTQDDLCWAYLKGELVATVHTRVINTEVRA